MDVIRTKTAQVARSTIVRRASRGEIQRVARGIYIDKDAIEDSMYVFSLRTAMTVFSHESALYLHGASNRTPFIHTVTVCNDKTLSKALRSECVCHYVNAEIFGLGVTERPTQFGNVVRCYDLERTICDLLKSTHTDAELINHALKEYAKSEGKRLDVLSTYAETLGVIDKVNARLGVLL